jgi:hypothetical protein
MKGMKVMYDYNGKIKGIIISAVGLALTISEKIHPWAVISRYTADEHLAFFKWVALLGLVTIAYSKEKLEDDRSTAIRLRSLQIAYMLQTAVILGMALTLSHSPEPIDASILFMMAAIGVVMHLLLFHIGLYFDDLWEYNDTTTLGERLRNIGRNKWSLLVYLAISGAMLLSLTIFA